MSDAYNFIFSDDPRTGTLTASQLDTRRKIAVALAARNRPYPKTIGEGLTALGEGLGEGMLTGKIDRAEAIQKQYDDAALRVPGSAPTSRPAPGGASIEGGPNAAVASATEDKQPLTPAQASQQPQMPIEEWLQRVARNESGSRKDAYTLVGERSRRGDYPYGKYQVMGENVPAWTQAYLGQKMTPQEFLADPDAQEKVARARGSEYVAKYGPDGAARAWFAGEKGMNDPNRKDTLGTHVAEYSRRFNIPLVSRDQVVASAARAPVDPENAAPVQVASLGGVPTPDTPPDVARDAVAQSLTAQQQSPPWNVAQADGLPLQPPVGSGGMKVAQEPGPAMPVQPPLGARPVQPAPTTDQGIRPIPTMPVRPDPGPEPTRTSVMPPAVRAEMQHWSGVMANPYVSDATKDFAKAKFGILQSQMNDEYTKQWTHWRGQVDKLADEKLAYPEKQIDLETKTLAAEVKRRELEGEGFIPLTKGEMAGLFPPGSPPPPQGQIYFKNRKGELKWGPTPPASTSVSVETKGETAFEQTRGKALADHFVKSFEQGQDAIGDLQTITELRERATKVGTGSSAVVQEALGRFGIKTEGLSQVQAFSALINRLTPTQRVPGSGPTSDFDARMFRDSLPRLMNTPEGNTMILDTMERLAKNKMDRAEIAGAVVAGSMTPKEGVVALNKLQADARTHSDGIKAYLDQQDKAGAGSATPAGTVQENKSTGQRRIMRPNGQWEILQ